MRGFLSPPHPGHVDGSLIPWGGGCSEVGTRSRCGLSAENSRTNISHSSAVLLFFLSLLLTFSLFISHVTCWLTEFVGHQDLQTVLRECFSREFYLNWKSQTLNVGRIPGGQRRPPPTYAEGDHFFKHPDRMFELKWGGSHLLHLILYLSHSSILPRMDLDFVKNHNYSTSILIDPRL